MDKNAPVLTQTQSRPSQKSGSAEMLTLSGTAAYRERIAMPADAVLTVQLQDISRADAPAQVVSQIQQTFGERQVPLPYRMQVPRTAIDPRMRYALRATVRVNGELRFATTQVYPVLTQSAASSASQPLNLVMQAIPAVADQQPGAVSNGASASLPPTEAPINTQTSVPQAPAHALQLDLPATFAGVLPCAGCPGIAHTLTLQRDGSYRLRRTYLGKDDMPVAMSGRWTADQSGQRLALHFGDEGSRGYFSVQSDGSLHALDMEGKPYPSQANLDLRRTARLDPVIDAAPLPPSTLTQPQIIKMQGADAVTLTGSGSNTGKVTDVGAAAATDVAANLLVARLQDTAWKLVALQGEPASMLPDQEREVRITLGSKKRQVKGFTGCNDLGGNYTMGGTALKFNRLVSTRKTCALAANTLEREVLSILKTTTSYRIDGEQLMLLGGGRMLARFEATYLR